VPRFYCGLCLKYFSSATGSKNHAQKKRSLNHTIQRLLVAGVSQREIARMLEVNRKTVVRKFLLMGERALKKLQSSNQKHRMSAEIQFDDMESAEPGQFQCPMIDYFEIP
jgi:transposase-like protein